MPVYGPHRRPLACQQVFNVAVEFARLPVDYAGLGPTGQLPEAYVLSMAVTRVTLSRHPDNSSADGSDQLAASHLQYCQLTGVVVKCIGKPF